MAGLTAPYADDVEDWISRSVQHVCRAVASPLAGEPVELDLSGCEVTLDDSWAPHVQARLELAAEDAEALQGILDPRYRCRVTIYAGYIYGGGTEDVHELATLHLRTVGGELRIDADSDEGLAQDRKYTAADGVPPRTGINELVQWAADKAVFPESAVVVSEFLPGHGATMLTELELEPGADYWDLLADAANRCGVWVHVGTDGRWYVRRRPQLVAETAVKLSAGPGGLLTDYPRKALDRDEFRNAVNLSYVWQDDARNEYRVEGYAAATGPGRVSVDRIGHLTYHEERSGPVTQAQAEAAAQTVLAYRLSRGNGYTLTGIAAYWVRPGQTCTVQPQRGPQERHLVQAVTFDPIAGLMTITTREPGE